MQAFFLDHTKILTYVWIRACVLCRHGREGIVRVNDTERWDRDPFQQFDCASLTFLKATIARDSNNNVLFVPCENDSIGIIDLREGQTQLFLPTQQTKGMVMANEGGIHTSCIFIFLNSCVGIAAFESGHIARIDARMRSIVEECKITSDPCNMLICIETFTFQIRPFHRIGNPHALHAVDCLIDWSWVIGIVFQLIAQFVYQVKVFCHYQYDVIPNWLLVEERMESKIFPTRSNPVEFEYLIRNIWDLWPFWIIMERM